MKKIFRTGMVTVCAVLSMAACKKDDISKPEILAPDNNGLDTITVGESLTLHPLVTEKQQVSYTWSLNGEVVGTDSVYTLIPENRGDYELSFKVNNADGASVIDYKIHVYGKYENGFYWINEGWFGHGTGTVSFYRYDTGVFEDSVFVKENPDKDLKPVSSTLQYGTLFRDKLYLLSKVGGPVVVADAYSLKEEKRIAAAGGNDWRAFVGIDANKGLLSSSSGVYPLDLETLTLGDKIAGIDGQVADMVKAGNYIYLLSQASGMVIIDAADYSIVKTVPSMQLGFALSKDGYVYAGGGKLLTKVNIQNLEVTQIDVPFTINGSWGAWHPGSIAASTVDNSVYIAKNDSWSGGNEIYRYTGESASLQSPLITLEGKDILYGAGLGFDGYLKQLVVTTVQSGYGENFSYNNLYFFHPQTGEMLNKVSYSGYYFPSVPAFH